MSCFSHNLPKEFNPIPQVVPFENAEAKIKNLTTKIDTFRKKYGYLPPKIRALPAVRILVIATLALGIAVMILALQGNLLTFPQNFLNALHQINWMYAGIGLGVFTVLTIGASIIIHRVRHQKDPITSQKIGGLSGDGHWVPAFYTRKDFPNSYFGGYIDDSNLNEQNTGYAFMYGEKGCYDHYSVSTMVTLMTPVHMVGAIVYNVLRLVIAPLYIAGCLCCKKDRGFTASDIPKEMGKTLLRILKAPFYATALIFAMLYSFIDPLNGRKLGAYIEKDWNEGVTRAEGFWSVQGPQSLWKFEGGGTRAGLGRNGFYLAGCHQPIGVVYYMNGKIVSGKSLSEAVQLGRGKSYKVITQDILVQRHNEAIVALKLQGTL